MSSSSGVAEDRHEHRAVLGAGRLARAAPARGSSRAAAAACPRYGGRRRTAPGHRPSRRGRRSARRRARRAPSPSRPPTATRRAPPAAAAIRPGRGSRRAPRRALAVRLAVAQPHDRQVRDREREQRAEGVDADEEVEVGGHRRARPRTAPRARSARTACRASGAGGRARSGSGGSSPASRPGARCRASTALARRQQPDDRRRRDRGAQRVRKPRRVERIRDRQQRRLDVARPNAPASAVDRQRAHADERDADVDEQDRRRRPGRRGAAGRVRVVDVSPARPAAASRPVNATVAIVSAKIVSPQRGDVPRSIASTIAPGSQQQRRGRARSAAAARRCRRARRSRRAAACAR